MFFAWFWDSKFIGEKACIEIYDKARVNGGSNYNYPGQRWIPKL